MDVVFRSADTKEPEDLAKPDLSRHLPSISCQAEVIMSHCKLH